MKKKTINGTFTNMVKIEYNWHRSDNQPIKQEHIKALEESANDRIFEQINEGYTSGELHNNVRMTDEDGEDGIEYSGWWGLTTERIN